MFPMFARFLVSIAQEDATIQHVDCAVGFHLGSGPIGDAPDAGL
jgi:hypothetical protein